MEILPTDSSGSLCGSQVIDNQGALVGLVDGVYLDERTEQPIWISIRTETRTRLSLAPLERALLSPDSIRLPYGKLFIEDAPLISHGQELTAEMEAVLYEYYDLVATSDSALVNGIPDDAA